MKDSLRENFSYFGLYKKMFAVKKTVVPQKVSFGSDKDQYFLYYEPEKTVSGKIIFWVHGGGWNAGTPKFFDFVGQCVAGNGYRFISAGYRLSPKNKYPCQIHDICACYKAAMDFLVRNGIDVSNVVVSGPSAGAHLSSILCYSKKVQTEYGVDVSAVIGFVGVGGPYCFLPNQSLSVKLLLNQLFTKDYERSLSEPVSLISKSPIPMLLIQSRHDGLIEFECAERFCAKATALGIKAELYEVQDRKNTHSWYTAGMFLATRSTNQTLNKFFDWIENLQTN